MVKLYAKKVQKLCQTIDVVTNTTV